MKPSAVIMNVGRGPVSRRDGPDNRARGESNSRGRSRCLRQGATPGRPSVLAIGKRTPFAALRGPHEGWLDDAMELFLENFHRFANGEPLKNLVDKEAGY